MIILGVLDLGSGEAETPEIVAERLRRALEVVPAERLVVAPDCGMKYLPRELAFAKLEAMVAGARARRGGSSGVTDPKTHIAQAFPDRVEVRGRDLTGDLMGRLTFTEYFHLLLTGEEPTEDQRFFLDLLLVSIAEHGMMPTNVAARMTLAADPGLAPGRRRRGDPRRRAGRARDLGGVRALLASGGDPAERVGRFVRRAARFPASAIRCTRRSTRAPSGSSSSRTSAG